MATAGSARRKQARWLRPLRTAGAVLVIWILLVGLLHFFQNSLLYFPATAITRTPADDGLRFDEVELPVDGGQRIAGWYVFADQPRGTLLYCHGNGGNLGYYTGAIRRFHDLGLDVFIFDYEGYGKSTGRPSEQATYRDARAAWNYLTTARAIPAKRVVVFGLSLGGAVAAWLAAEVDPAALIVESSFTSLPDLARELYPFLAFRRLIRYRYDTLSTISTVGCPVLVAHSRDDEIVGYRHAERLFAAAPEPKSFIEMRGSHNDGPDSTGAAYTSELRRFLETVLP